MNISRNIQLLSWFNFFSAFKLYSAIAVIYFAQITHSYALGISVFSIVQVSTALFEIPTGVLSDRVGRKYTVLCGALVRGVSLLCYATGQSYAVFVIGAVFEGVALAFFSGNNDALLYDTLTETGKKDTYHEYLGKTKSMLYPSLMIASLLGGLIASVSFPLVFWLSLVPQFICVVLALQMVEPKKHFTEVESIATQLKGAFKLLYTNIQLRRLSVAEILKTSIEDILFNFQILFYNTLWPLWAVGLTRSIMAITKFVSFRYSGKVITRLTASRALILNDVVTRVIHILAILFPSILSPVVMCSTGLLWGVSNVAKNKLLQEQFTNKQRATMSSVISFFGNLLAGVVAVGIGAFSDKLGLINTLLVMQLFFIPIIFLYIQFRHATRNRS
jgi:MFS family permease